MSRTYQQSIFSIQSILLGAEPSTLPTEKINRIVNTEKLLQSIEEICRQGVRIQYGRNSSSPFGEYLSYHLVGNALVETKIRDALSDRYWTTITSEGEPNTDIVGRFAELYGHAPEKRIITVP